MKKRIACLLLTLVMLVSLIPTAAITASATPTTVSEAGIKVVKSYVGFHKTAYETSKGSGKYLIGYGLPGTKGETITESHADQLLRTKLNALAATIPTIPGMVQKRLDALTWLMFVEDKTGYTDLPTVLTTAVSGNVVGSAFADAMITMGFETGYPDTAEARSLMATRMAICNLYLNGAYKAASTGSFGYTVFDAGDGKFPNGAKKMVQAFDGTETVAIKDDISTFTNYPKLDSADFMGWYNGSTMVSGVGPSTRGKTLTAKWQIGTSPIEANYKMPTNVIFDSVFESYGPTEVSGNMVTVYAQHDVTSAQVDYLKRNKTVTVVNEYSDKINKWIELSTGGWVKLSLINKLSSLPIMIVPVTVTIIDDFVNVRDNHKVTATKIGQLKRGDKVTIVMTAENDKWGYYGEGWILLNYTTFFGEKGMTSTSSDSAVPSALEIPGVVTGAEEVNVRSGAGVANPIVTKLREGTAVTVYEKTTVDGAPWGRIDQGWISLQYVRLTETSSSTTSQPANGVATGTTVYVSSTVSLNVRSGPGTEFTKIASMAPGTAVVVLQKHVVNGVTWALTDQGWINMNYVSTRPVTGGSAATAGIGGTVVNCSSGVNIRSAAGTTNALVGVAPLGSRVTVTERVLVNGFYWGKIDGGWVCMDYIQLDREWVDSKPINKDEESTEGLITSFDGYPAVTDDQTELYASASTDSKSLMTLAKDAKIKILARTKVGNKIFGKVTIGAATGWIDLDAVTLSAVSVKVTAASANTYELPNTRSKFYAALPKGTELEVGAGGNANWVMDGTILWAKVSGHNCWINMADVTMFKENSGENKVLAGINTLSGVGYLTGTVNNATILYKDENGNPTETATQYTLVEGHRVNIVARSYVESKNTTFAKVTIGSVTGWVNMSDITLDEVVMKVTTDIKAYTTKPADMTAAPDITLKKDSILTVLTRELIPDSNEINHGMTDVGKVYVGDNTSPTYWVALDEGKLSYTSSAPKVDSANPVILSTVVVSGTANGDIYIMEEAETTSNKLLQLAAKSKVTVSNWKLVSGVTWCKVQVGNIVGWVQFTDIDFSTLKCVVNVDQLSIYNDANKDSSVQVLRVNNKAIKIEKIVFDGSILWGETKIDSKFGWIDLAQVRMNTPNAYYAPELVIATGKINTVNTIAENVSSSSVITLAKGTAVHLMEVKIDAGKVYWRVDLGDMDGWINMDCIDMNYSVARVTEPSLDIWEDLAHADDTTDGKKLYTLYRDETVTILRFKKQPDANKLYGEVAYGDTTGWILLCDKDTMKVTLTPGSTGSTLGGTTAAPSTAPTTAATGSNPIPAYIVCSNTVNVRSGAGVENPVVTTLRNGTNVRIYEQTTVIGKGWAHIDEGWVCMDYVQLGTQTGGTTTSTSTGSGSVSIMTTVPGGAIAVGFANEDIKIRSGSGLGYPEVGSVKKGNSLVIYEKKLDGGMSWGRTDSGWVCISYLTITGIGATGSGNMGTVACNYTANVRSNANSGSALMAKVMVTSRVVIRDTMVVGSETWGLTDLGWILMQYVTMDGSVPTAPLAPVTPEATTPSDTYVAPEALGPDVTDVG